MIVKLLTERYLEFLSLKGGCRGSSESTLVKMSNCWKSHVLAHFISVSGVLIMCYATVHKNNWIKAAGNIHNDFLMKVLRAPMSFFDTTPTGRIVNRFSKDIESIDHGLPQRMGEMIDACCTVMSVSFVIVYTMPALTAIVIPLILAFYVMSVSKTNQELVI